LDLAEREGTDAVMQFQQGTIFDLPLKLQPDIRLTTAVGVNGYAFVNLPR
jgi:hypothetical protein